MKRIVITNYGSRMNKGDIALLKSRIQALKEYIPDAEFSVFAYHPEIDNKREMEDLQGISIKFYDVLGRIKLSPSGIFKTLTHIFKIFLYGIGLNKGSDETGIQEYYDADVIISTGGDVLTEDYRSPFSIFINLMFGILLNKPVVLYAESIGPFNKKWNRIIARFLCNRMSLITLREEISLKHLKDMGINKVPIYVTTDSAFLLKPASQQKIKDILLKEGVDANTKPLIGMSVSKVITRFAFMHIKDKNMKYSKYIDMMSKVIDYLIEKWDATVIFVPHVIEPWRGNDDRIIAEDIIKLVKNRYNCISIKEEYSVNELKGIIGECHLFIGARMHATVSSTSMCVPTIALAYSHKTHGVIGKTLGMEKYVLDAKNLGYDTLISKIEDVWENKEDIKRKLENKMDYVEELAVLNAKLVKDLLK